ncbi:GTPase [Sphaerisporangium sp. B11E5]|uniref:GTPase family protein n=1 Tax=Sphaerisporangium sp. B11E5 TaxID=3153563 RepID=UPI00325DDD5B
MGKSSLLNALFGARLTVGDVKPVPEKPQSVTVPGNSGHHLTFWDMPGIGESPVTDPAYAAMYVEKLAEADVVIWAVHADSRSAAYDAERLRVLLAGADDEERRHVMSKLTVVLTKADTLTPPPWIFDMRGRHGTFVPSAQLAGRLEAKAAYFEQALLEPWDDLLTATTYNTGGFTVSDDRLTFDGHAVRYRGHFSQRVCDAYSAAHPEHAEVFNRLRDNHRVLPCSSLFRYNLAPLLVTVVNKLGPTAIFRFQRLLDDVAALGGVPVADMRGYGNFMIWDGMRGVTAFDLGQYPLHPL